MPSAWRLPAMVCPHTIMQSLSGSSFDVSCACCTWYMVLPNCYILYILQRIICLRAFALPGKPCICHYTANTTLIARLQWCSLLEYTNPRARVTTLPQTPSNRYHVTTTCSSVSRGENKNIDCHLSTQAIALLCDRVSSY